MSSSAPSSSKAFQTILAGRKCYRMSKDKNEVVWPMHLEAALMEGLEKYAPAESKSPRGLTRFPNRNKFIAEYILKKTGEIRTAKQVGSRIQQLRDTSAGKHIMKAISDRHYEMMHPARPNNDVGYADGGNDGSFSSMGQVVHVYISVPTTDGAGWQLTNGRQTEVNVMSSSAYQWVEPRNLRSIDPTVYFRSAAALSLSSTSTVYCGQAVVHVDQPVLMSVQNATDPVTGQPSYLHYTTLAPRYWETLCGCPDLAPYTIVQEISRQPTDPSQKPAPLMVIQYHFNTSAAPPLSPFSLSDDELENIDYETDELLHAHGHHAHTHALSTCSDSPRPYSSGGRGSSPAYSTAPGFQSVPLSPVEWVPPPQQDASCMFPFAQTASSAAVSGAQYTGASSASASSGYYGLSPASHSRGWQPAY